MPAHSISIATGRATFAMHNTSAGVLAIDRERLPLSAIPNSSSLARQRERQALAAVPNSWPASAMILSPALASFLAHLTRVNCRRVWLRAYPRAYCVSRPARAGFRPDPGTTVPRVMFALCVLLGICSGCHASAGPVVGYAFDRGMTLGWEAGGGPHLLLRANVGQSIRSSPSEQLDDRASLRPPTPIQVLPLVERVDEDEVDEDEVDEDELDGAVHSVAAAPAVVEREEWNEVASYVAFEPGFGGGGTIGVSIKTASPDLGLVAGGWAGSPLRIQLLPQREDSDSTVFVSVAVGYRYLFGAHEIYLTPKVGIYDPPKL